MYEERFVLSRGRRVEMRIERGARYRLACLVHGKVALEYSGDGARHRRRLHGRETRYDFRSVEQLRYDFERDVADAAPAP